MVCCKSGLDRTGIFSAVQLGVACLWQLHPQLRWTLHLAAINFNLIRGRMSDGASGFVQPPPPGGGPDGYLEHRRTFSDALQHPWHVLYDACTRSSAGPSRAGEGDRDSILRMSIFDGETDELAALVPTFCLLRNFVLVYSCEINGRITLTSNGVRGLKYTKHAFVAQFMPQSLALHSGEVANLVERQMSAIKQFAGTTKLTTESLTKLGKELLCDCSKLRCS